MIYEITTRKRIITRTGTGTGIGIGIGIGTGTKTRTKTRTSRRTSVGIQTAALLVTL